MRGIVAWDSGCGEEKVVLIKCNGLFGIKGRENKFPEQKFYILKF